MTQYDDQVEQQRLKILAAKWAKGVKTLHAHSLNSMWYDDRPEDTSEGKRVIDKEFNDGLVERTLADNTVVLFEKDRMTGTELISAFTQNN